MNNLHPYELPLSFYNVLNFFGRKTLLDGSSHNKGDCDSDIPGINMSKLEQSSVISRIV